MITLRRSEDRFHTKTDWLDSRHTFSFADHYDPNHTGFRALRVINDDLVQPKRGFGMHPHRDMEIISYILQGALEHKDSMGNSSTIRPDEVQRMSAGTGVLHSEFNPSDEATVHLLQIWILPERQELTPEYEQKMFHRDARRGSWLLIASRDGREGSVTVHQDVSLYVTLLEAGERVSHGLNEGKHAWLHVASGDVLLNEQQMISGSGAAISNERSVDIVATKPSELLLFELA